MNCFILKNLLRELPDKTYLSLKYFSVFGKLPNWKNPQTYSEKLQWLKLYDRRPEYTMMVDKYAVKKYVADIIGEEYVIPTLGVWNKPEDLEWDKLPDQFVLKTTHGGGNTGVVICRDKASFDRQKAIEKLNESLQTDLYKVWREWPYKNVPRRIIAEKYIEPRPDTKDLPDYKFFCFDGKVKGLFVATERQDPNEEVKFDFFDENYNHLPLRQGHDHAKVTPRKPVNFELMKQAAEQLSKGLAHVRVDLYDLGDRVLFGELTLFHFSGMVPFEPDEWDKHFGDMLTLPGKRLGGVIIRQNTDGELIVSQTDLPDYKLFCFNGEVKMLYIATGRHLEQGLRFDFFDNDFNHLPFCQKDHPNADICPLKPQTFEKMKKLACQLSRNMPHVRVDFYEVRGKVYFGEMTFYSMSGMTPYEPSEWDIIIGSYLTLPNN